MNTILYPEIMNFTQGYFKEEIPEVIIQEKLDGCNFRLIFDYENKSITYGSRNCILDVKNSKFHNFTFLIPEFEKSVFKLAEVLKQNFIVVGELLKNNIGSCSFKYFDKNVVKFYAYEIIIPNKTNTELNLVRYLEKKKNVLCDISFIEFKEGTILLKQCDFDVIDYDVLVNISEDNLIKYLHNFKSVLFNHKDMNKMEGYVIRAKLKTGEYCRLKYKTEYILEKTEGNFISLETFKSFLTKGPNLDDNKKVPTDILEEVFQKYLKELDLKITQKHFNKLFHFLTVYQYIYNIKNKNKKILMEKLINKN